MVECEYCRGRRCIKCIKISDSVYKNLGGRDDFPFFCAECLPKAMRCIKEDCDIEARCNAFLASFKLEVNSRLAKLETDIQEMKTQLEEKDPSTTSNKGAMLDEACSRTTERLSREKIW